MTNVIMTKWLELQFGGRDDKDDIIVHLVKIANFKEGICHEEGDHCQVACVVPHRAVDPPRGQLSNLMKKIKMMTM